MPAFDQISFYLLAALALGLIVGVILTRSLSSRHAHHNDVRWRRRFNEMQAEHELRLATLTKTLRHTEEKRDNIRLALEESEETIRLLSADRSTTYDQDIVDRNNRIAELKTTLSHARAKLADAQDHESMLQQQVDRLQIELAHRDDPDDELSRNAETGETELNNGARPLHTKLDGIGQELSGLNHSVRADSQPGAATQDRAKVISLHEHPFSDDLVAGAINSEQKIRALEIELQEWKRKYEGANGGDRQSDDEILQAINGIEDYSEATAEAKDDLKQIRGIGPALETALNKLGFFQYEQLARMGQHDIEQIGRHDRSLPGRIRRYKWVEQARKLQQSGQTGGNRPNV